MKTLALYSMALLLSCAAAHKSAAPAAAPVGQPDSLRDGSSFDKAIIIQETQETPGVAAEYKWIRDHEPGFSSQEQSLANHNNIPYDILHIKNADGVEKYIYFDISHYFGKF
jgi:hypothetical protein